MFNNGSNNMKSESQNSQFRGSTSNYTLPGVINYLTSEFTNLERFKIVTNLEKTEMKHQILYLQGELNTLKLENMKYQTKIRELEEENKRLLNKNGSEKLEEANSSFDKSLSTNGRPLLESDLDIIKNSKDRLASSMQDILELLKPPGSAVESVAAELESSQDYSSLVNAETSDAFRFNPSQESFPRSSKGSRKGQDFLSDVDYSHIKNFQSQKSELTQKEDAVRNRKYDKFPSNSKPVEIFDLNEAKEDFPALPNNNEESDSETINGELNGSPELKRPNFVKLPSLDSSGISELESGHIVSTFLSGYTNLNTSNFKIRRICVNSCSDIIGIVKSNSFNAFETEIDIFNVKSNTLLHTISLSNNAESVAEEEIKSIHVLHSDKTASTLLLITTAYDVKYVNLNSTPTDLISIIVHSGSPITKTELVSVEGSEKLKLYLMTEKNSKIAAESYDLDLISDSVNINGESHAKEEGLAESDSQSENLVDLFSYSQGPSEQQFGQCALLVFSSKILILDPSTQEFNIISLPRELDGSYLRAYKDEYLLFLSPTDPGVTFFLYSSKSQTIISSLLVNSKASNMQSVVITEHSGLYQILLLTESHIFIYDTLFALKDSIRVSKTVKRIASTQSKLLAYGLSDDYNNPIMYYDIDSFY